MIKLITRGRGVAGLTHLPVTQEIASSNLVGPAILKAEIAQLVEQWTENPRVPSSSLGLGTINFFDLKEVNLEPNRDYKRYPRQ